MVNTNVNLGVNLTSNRSWIVYLATIGAIMAALKLKETWDDYNHELAIQQAREENARRDASGNTGPRLDVENLSRRRPKRKPGCCICCGIDFRLFWKATGIFILCTFAKNVYVWKFMTGLEGMPAFGTSLSCHNAPFIYKESATLLNIPIDNKQASHSLEVVGDAVGTIMLAQGEHDATDVKYEMAIRAEDKALLRHINIQKPSRTKDAGADLLRISTPRGSKSCMRYDIKLYIPEKLKNLRITSHTKTQIQFDAGANAELDKLFVSLKKQDPDNMLLPTYTIRARNTTLGIADGWLVGDIALVEEAQIHARSKGVTNLHVYPTEPKDITNPETAILKTSSGAGRTDIFYTSSKVNKRPISSTHTAGKGDMYLQYQEAEFSGQIGLNSPHHTTYAVETLPQALRKAEDKGKWSLWYGDNKGEDRLYAQSHGWIGLNFNPPKKSVLDDIDFKFAPRQNWL